MGAPVLKTKKAVGFDSVRPRLLRLILCLLFGSAHFGQTGIKKIIPKIKVSARNSVNQSDFTFHVKFHSL
jgi:hypothetical protein